MENTGKIDYSKKYGNDGRILSGILKEAQGVDYLGYIAYALYKRDKIEAIKKYKEDNPSATDEDIQQEKDSFRFSRCNKRDIKRYLKDAKDIDNEMYGKKIQDFIQGFQNGANGEREQLGKEVKELLSSKIDGFIQKFENSAQYDRNQIKNDLNKLLSEEIGKAINKNYQVEKKSNYFRGVTQSFLGTIIWVIVTILVGLYFKYGKQYDSPGANINKTSIQQTVKDTVDEDDGAKMTVKYN